MNDRRRIVFRGDDFNKDAINKVPAGDQSMKTMAAVLHTRLQDLTDAKRKLLTFLCGTTVNQIQFKGMLKLDMDIK